MIEAYLISSGLHITSMPAQIDTGSDYTAFSSHLAANLQLSLPFSRQVGFSGAGGTQASSMSFAPDGEVALFLTDYREYCYLPTPLIGFYSPGSPGARQRSVLGLTGVLQFYRFSLDSEPFPPQFELDPVTNFPGVHGMLPRGISLHDFIRSLRSPP
jgi:hypothetical protein